MFWWLFFCGVRDIFIRDIAKLSCESNMVTKNAKSGIIEDSMLPANKFVVSSVYKIFIRRFMESQHKETPFYRILGFNLSRDKQDFLTASLSSLSGVNELTALFCFGKSCYLKNGKTKCVKIMHARITITIKLRSLRKFRACISIKENNLCI